MFEVIEKASAMIFDLDDTLYDRRVPFEKACRELFDLDVDTDYQKVHTRFLKHGNDVFEASMTGEITMEEMYIYRIRETLKELGKNISDAQALTFQERYVWNQHHIEVDPAIIPFLDACVERKLFMGIITNGKSGHQRDKFHVLGLERWFDERNFLASGDIGINKPDPGIFEHAVREWQLQRETTWYVGDSYEHDIISAGQAGLKTIWINKKQEQAGEFLPDKIVRVTSHSQQLVFL